MLDVQCSILEVFCDYFLSSSVIAPANALLRLHMILANLWMKWKPT
jgi:hypothetical protein